MVFGGSELVSNQVLHDVLNAEKGFVGDLSKSFHKFLVAEALLDACLLDGGLQTNLFDKLFETRDELQVGVCQGTEQLNLSVVAFLDKQCELCLEVGENPV